jgi:hypothetical protein
MWLLLLTHKVLEDPSRLLPEGIGGHQLGFQALNGGAKGVLNLGIQVEKCVAQSLGQTLSQGGFPDATHTDETNLHAPCFPALRQSHEAYYTSLLVLTQ